jgi:hypothetical protein
MQQHAIPDAPQEKFPGSQNDRPANGLRQPFGNKFRRNPIPLDSWPWSCNFMLGMEPNIKTCNTASELAFSIGAMSCSRCIASAILMLSAFASEAMAQESESGKNLLTYPAPRDFAQAVQVPNPISLGYPKEWYRLALPLSSACFLVSFAIWSLHSVENQALRPLIIEDEGRT